MREQPGFVERVLQNFSGGKKACARSSCQDQWLQGSFETSGKTQEEEEE
jgi:hypothetical protein